MKFINLKLNPIKFYVVASNLIAIIFNREIHELYTLYSYLFLMQLFNFSNERCLPTFGFLTKTFPHKTLMVAIPSPANMEKLGRSAT